MMNNLPDNWEHTDGEEEVPVRSVKPSIEDTSNTKTVSRKPAAIVGIAIVTIAGFLFFNGLDSLRGQLDSGDSPNLQDNIIIIDSTGINPNTVYVNSGDTLTWENRQEIPHYLVSDTLCETSGECMSTTTMFPLSEGTYDIPLSVTSGTFTYFSPTDSSLQGIIIVGDGTGNASSQESENSSESNSSSEEPHVDDNLLSQLSIQDSSSSSNIEETSSSSSQSEEINPLLDSIRKQLEQDRKGETVINVNTNTGTPRTNTNSDVPGVPHNPYATGINQNTVPESNQNQYNLVGNTVQKPLAQPSTGTGSWAIGIFIFISIFMITAIIGKREILYK